MTREQSAMHHPSGGQIAHFIRAQWLVPVLAFATSAGFTLYWLSAQGDVDHNLVFVGGTSSLLTLMFLASRITRTWPRWNAMLLERREIFSLQSQLDQAMRGTARVFHAVHCQGFGVDHVVVASGGVFAVTVEFLPQPEGAQATGLFDGEFLHVGAAAPVREPVARARIAARGLGDLLSDRLGHWGRVTPVLLLPGWSVQQPNVAIQDTWVTSLQDFLRRLEKLPMQFDLEDLLPLRTAMTEIVRDAKRRVGHLARSGQMGR